MGFRLPKSKGMLRRAAADWLARLQSARDPEVQRRFQHWHDTDPRHAAAFERVKRSYEQAGLLRQSPLARSVSLEHAVPRQGWTARPALAAAAALVIVPGAVLLFRSTSFSLGGTDAVMLMTSVGEIRQVSLADGSKVTLDTSTKVEVEIGRSHRSAHLRYGRARFQIAEASAPFVVDTANTTITARQAVIDVERGASQDQVEVLAGAADVHGSAQQKAVALGAGESAAVTPAGPDRSIPPAVSDWTRGMLQFDNTPIADAVLLANRYSGRHVIILGDLADFRVTGAFRAGDTIGLAKALAAAFSLSLEQRPDGTLLLSRPPSANVRNKNGG